MEILTKAMIERMKGLGPELISIIVLAVFIIIVVVIYSHSWGAKARKKRYSGQNQNKYQHTGYTNAAKVNRYPSYDERVKVISQNAGSIYKLKSSLMNDIEQKAFYYCIKALEPYGVDTYYAFPQVRISAFVSISPFIAAQQCKDATGAITSKSVDILICRKDNIGMGYLYVPILAIEVDGGGHESNDSHFFKDNLLPAINLQFRRLAVESRFLGSEHEITLSGWIKDVCRTSNSHVKAL